MGSIGAMKGRSFSKDRYFQGDVEEVDEARPRGHRGPRALQGAARRRSSTSSSADCGGHGLLRRADDRGAAHEAHFVRITGAGLRESHPHDVMITKEAPNYRRG